jgi:uncharacterized membrane protein
MPMNATERARSGALPWPLRFLRLMGAVGWRTVAGALMLGGILHIGMTLAAPTLTHASAFLKLREVLAANRMVVLPPAGPGKRPLPFMAPDALFAICRYDLTVGPLAVIATLPDIGWSLSLHTPNADNYYAMPGQQSRRIDASLVLVPATDRGDFVGGTHRATPLESQVESPTLEGLVVIRAPLRGLAWQASAEAALAKASCTSQGSKR